MSGVPALRVTPVNAESVRHDGAFVCYWMTACRRTGWSFGFERAVEWARELNKPLLVLEALRCDYRWASDRLHRFVIDGMLDNAARLKRSGVLYYPYLEPAPGAGRGLLAALGSEACVVVTDDFPAFFLPRAVAAAGAQLPVRLERVDSNGLMPLAASDHAYPTAFAFRRFVHGALEPHLERFPEANPLRRFRPPPLSHLPRTIENRWPAARLADDLDLAAFPIDHGVPPAETRGGPVATRAALKRFLRERLARYGERNDPGRDVTSELSPYLHFGHIGVHQVFAELVREVGWSPLDIAPSAAGRRSGWWGTNEAAEAFLDELITWRELGFNMCVHEPAYDRYESLPEWARRTLAEHAKDPRPERYDREQLETAATHDPLWNAAQSQLVREGRIHNYLRMLWGKKILEWTGSPEEALDVMIDLNNAYALDGRDPNSYSGIFWVLGRYDRAWGPERPIFGKIRYMTSENTARKFNVRAYLDRYGSVL